MRLSSHEVDVIKKAVHRLDGNAQIYLFGSRVDDQLKGGDIDLLIVTEALSFNDKIDIQVAIKKELGEQKIDILLRNNSQTRSDPFVTEILTQAKNLDSK